MQFYLLFNMQIETLADFHKLIHSDSSGCPESERREVAAGCVIANKRCKCFHKSYHCSNSLHHTWDFQNLLVSIPIHRPPTQNTREAHRSFDTQT